MPRATTDPLTIREQKPDIGFQTAHIAKEDNRLWQALERLRKAQTDPDWSREMIYEGALAIGTNVLTHLFVVDIPTDKKIELVSMTASVFVSAVDKIEVKFKRRLYTDSDSDTTNAKWESIHDSSNLFISKGRRTGSRDSFLVSELNNGDQLQMDIISTGSASNLQVAIRGKLRPL